ncbi:MAG: class I SAM-dependent methyltransferase [Marmoricola sp.]
MTTTVTPFDQITSESTSLEPLDEGLPPVQGGLRTAVASRIARRLFLSAVDRCDVTVHLDGRTYGRGGPSMTVHRPEELFARIGVDKNIGFGEAYMTGAWSSPDLAAFLTVLASRVSTLIPPALQALRAVVMPRPYSRDRGAKADTQRNIARHYDLSNDLFALFLDSTMSYSSARFEEDADGRPVVGGDLRTAQIRKIDDLLDMAEVGQGTRVLEIGSGWGALAIRAAQRGATVRTITLSVEQQELARERIAEAGLTDAIQVELCDYRDVDGSYDAVISVEMIEAVGWRYWPTYFEAIDRVLAPGGRAVIQAITMPHNRMLATRNTYTWINKYIFPGGFLPSIEALETTTREHTGLRLTRSVSIGQHYAETLRQWDARFVAQTEAWRALGFDEIFGRLWHFYLEYSRAGFASGYLDDYQLLFTRPSELG